MASAGSLHEFEVARDELVERLRSLTASPATSKAIDFCEEDFSAAERFLYELSLIKGGRAELERRAAILLLSPPILTAKEFVDRWCEVRAAVYRRTRNLSPGRSNWLQSELRAVRSGSRSIRHLAQWGKHILDPAISGNAPFSQFNLQETRSRIRAVLTKKKWPDDVGDLAAAAAKLTSYCARIALVLHLSRLAAGESVDPYVVDQVSLSTSIDLTEWFAHEARRVYSALAESDEEREIRQLVDLIGRRGGRITVRALQHASRRYRDSAEEAEAQLRALVKAGLANVETVHRSRHARGAHNFITNGRGEVPMATI